jgi:uncharacterized protein with ATP-grasp and redox domains
MPESAYVDAELPPPLMTSEPGSFARRTIVERKPQIIRWVIEDNDYPPAIVLALETFSEEIASRPMRPLREQVSDAVAWNEAFARYAGKTWFEVDWYFAEAYFYRRLLEVVRYFQPGPWAGRDPFEPQKRERERVAVDQLAEIGDQLAGVEPTVVFEALLHSALWGNRADLSNHTVIAQVRGGLAARDERHNLLIDHTGAVRSLLAGGVRRVDFFTDNVGADVLFDLVLADFLLGAGWAQKVVFHLKGAPFFVSDAMAKDVWATVSLLQTVSSTALRDLGGRLHTYLDSGRLNLEDGSFWTSWHMFRDFPAALRRDLSRADLVILKGDVNYRRLLDDRHWPYTARLEEITRYFPASFLVLRTLKCEIMVGLEPGWAETLAAEDPDWLINGQRGIIHLLVKR